MTSFLLDTSVMSELLRGNAVVRRRYEAALAAGDDLFISTITEAELISTAFFDKYPTQRYEQVSALLDIIDVLPIQHSEMATGASMRGLMFLREGVSVSWTEGLLIGLAGPRRWVLATTNFQTLGRFNGFTPVAPQVQDWGAS